MIVQSQVQKDTTLTEIRINEVTISAIINNLLNTKYVSNGYHYTYDDTWSNPDQVVTYEGVGYYPQATRNYLLGFTFKF